MHHDYGTTPRRARHALRRVGFTFCVDRTESARPGGVGFGLRWRARRSAIINMADVRALNKVRRLVVEFRDLCAVRVVLLDLCKLHCICVSSKLFHNLQTALQTGRCRKPNQNGSSACYAI